MTSYLIKKDGVVIIKSDSTWFLISYDFSCIIYKRISYLVQE